MLSIRRISPMFRAIGTMGAVAAVVGGVTFAQLTSNTVALSPNNLTTDTASLAIGAGTGCPEDDTTPSVTGLQDSNLAPGGSTHVSFCLDNKSDFAMTITAGIPQNLSGSTAAQDTTLTVSCPSLGADLVGTLSSWGPANFGTSLAAGTHTNCTATAALSGSYSGQGGEVIPQFDINFFGTQVE